MTTFAVTNSGQVLDSVNYLLSNLSTGNVTGNITVPDGTLVANVATGQITATGNVSTGSNAFSYLNQWMNLRYANNATGSSGFSTLPTNSQYFGVYNSNIATPSSNPTEYVWRQVAGGFGTTKTIYYSSIGGRQVQFAASNVAPSSNFVISVANVAIDLDVITTAAGLPGERGPVVMSYVLTTADPTTASSSTLTGWFSSPRTNSVAPIGTGLSPVVGDTALFTYTVNPLSQDSINAAYEYNGSVWVSVVPQVVSGNAVVDNTLNGTAVIGNTLPGNTIVVGTVTGDRITVGTLTGNLIAANTITGNLITVGTLTGNLIAANTITGNNISANTITGTNIVGNTITGDLIAANTISANSIQTNSITSTQISSSYIYAGNIVSFGATLGNISSPGYWLQYNTGNARFGGNVSIGANLNVAGLITTGNLIANTVNTTQVVPAAVSSGSQVQSSVDFVTAPAGINLIYYEPTSNWANVTTTLNNQDVYIYGQTLESLFLTVTSTVTSLDFYISLYRRNPTGTIVTPIKTFQIAYGSLTPGSYVTGRTDNWVGYLDTLPTPGTWSYFFGFYWTRSGGGATMTNITIGERNIVLQTLKR